MTGAGGGRGWGRRGRLRVEQRRLEGDLRALDERLDALVALGRSTHQAQRDAINAALERNRDALRDGATRCRPVEQRPWTDPGWETWTPAKAPPISPERRPSGITVGQLRDARSGHGLGLAVEVDPLAAGLPIVIRSRAGQHRDGNRLLQSLVVRSAVLLSGRASYGLVDPVGGGRAFPLAGDLPTLVAATGDRRRDLEAVMAEIDRRAAGAAGLANREDRRLGPVAGPPATVVAVAGFPEGYDRRTAEWLQSLCRSGPAAGVHLLIHHQVEARDPVHLGETVVVDLAQPRLQVDDTTPPTALDLDVAFDVAPTVTVARRLLEQVRTVDDEVVRWDELGHPDEDAWCARTRRRGSWRRSGGGPAGRDPWR